MKFLRTLALLTLTLTLTLVLLTGCGQQGGGDGGEEMEKVNVFTSQKFVAKDFVIQLSTEEYVTMARNLITDVEEGGSCPETSPDFILQYIPPDGGESDYWWLWVHEDGSTTLVNSTVSKTAAYHSTKVTSHDWGLMIEKATDGKGPV